jgi:hypothetical protein
MDPEATLPLPQDGEDSSDIFRIGEETILKMQDQRFEIDDYGTHIGSNVDASAVLGVVVATEAPVSSGSLTRIEQKLDLTLRALEGIQRRVDSLDATIAHLLAR